MHIKYNVSIDDIVAFSQFHCKHSASIRRNNIAWGILLPVGIFALFCLDGLYRSRWDLPVAGGVISGILMSWMLGGQRRRLEKAARKMLSEGSNKVLLGEHELEITEAALISRGGYGENKFTWDVIERIGFTPDYTFIFIGATQGIPVAKSSMLEGDYREFRNELRRKFDEKVKTQDTQLKQRVITDTARIYKGDAGFGKHSGRGIASFVIAMAVGVFDLLLFGLMVVIGAVASEQAQKGSAVLRIFSTGITLGLAANIVGVALGVSGLCQKNRKKVFAILGLIFNLAAVIGFGILIAIHKATS